MHAHTYNFRRIQTPKYTSTNKIQATSLSPLKSTAKHVLLAVCSFALSLPMNEEEKATQREASNAGEKGTPTFHTHQIYTTNPKKRAHFVRPHSMMVICFWLISGMEFLNIISNFINYNNIRKEVR